MPELDEAKLHASFIAFKNDLGLVLGKHVTAIALSGADPGDILFNVYRVLGSSMHALAVSLMGPLKGDVDDEYLDAACIPVREGIVAASEIIPGILAEHAAAAH